MIPQELRDLPRWCFTGTEKDGAMVKAPFALDGEKFEPISVTSDHDKLITYAELEPLLEQHPDRGFGFVLTEGDGYTCVDIDIKDDTPITFGPKMYELVRRYVTYTEYSTSGCGYHLWFGGEVKGSYKKWPFEIYSRERFIICTNNVGFDCPISRDVRHIHDFNQYIDDSRAEFNLSDKDQPQAKCDNEIIAEAYTHDHSGKFACLMEGDWDTYTEIMWKQHGSEDYSFDASQADAAFMTIVTHYSRNIEQCKRLWRMSALGNMAKRYPGDPVAQRRKARNTGTDYKLHRAISHGMERNIKDEYIREEMAKEGAKLASALKQKRVEERKAADVGMNLNLPPLGSAEMTYPPGWMGILSEYFFDISKKPIKEFAILEALSMCSGIFGRAYNISQTGLNNYFMVLAASGTGKSELTTNPMRFMRYLEREKGIIDASRFIVDQRFTHENSMFKFYKENTSFVQTLSEFGKQFRTMVKGDGATTTVREQMTDIYSKSGWMDAAGGVKYTDSEKSVTIGHPVAYSFLGESVPEPFFDAIDNETFADGFVSRFMFTEYTGPIPYDSYPADVTPSAALTDHMCAALLGVLAAMRDQNNVAVVHVGRAPEVSQKFDEFSRYCTDQQNLDKSNVVWNALWARANLKMLKLCGLLAVMDNPVNPIVNNDHMTWAWEFVNRHNHLIWNAVRTGRMGTNVSSSERAEFIESVIRKFIDSEFKSSDRVSKTLYDKHMVSYSYISRNCKRVRMFDDVGHRTTADLIESALRELCQTGVLRMVPSNEVKEFTKRSYKVYQYLGTE